MEYSNKKKKCSSLHQVEEPCLPEKKKGCIQPIGCPIPVSQKLNFSQVIKPFLYFSITPKKVFLFQSQNSDETLSSRRRQISVPFATVSIPVSICFSLLVIHIGLIHMEDT